MATKYYSDGTYTKGDGKLYYPGVGVVGTDKSTNVSKAESGSSTSTSSSTQTKKATQSSSNSNRYNTTVTKKNGTTASGYIEDGKSYYSDGTRISVGDSVVDAQGKVWTMEGSSDPDAGLSINDYLAKYGVSNSTNTNKNTYQSEDETNPYDAYAERLQKEYAKQQELIEEKNRLAVEQGVNRLNAQKTNINQSADDNARQAYVMYMQNKKALPQQLASQGVTGGATETANLGLSSNYENNVNSINQNRTNSLQEIDNAITDLQNSGDLSTVEQVIANNEAALNAYKEAFAQKQSYNQWATEFNANRSDVADSINYRDKVYADQMAQQELENQWYKDTYSDSKKQEETNRVITLLQSGMVDVNYASTLLGVPVDQINSYVEYINKMRNLEMQSQQASINNTYSTINNRNNSSGGSDATNNENGSANNYYNLATQINNMYASNTTGKNAGDAVIVDDGMGGYTINPNISRGSYLDLVIARAFDSNMSDNEVKTFLNNLGISDTEISRVGAYYLK